MSGTHRKRQNASLNGPAVVLVKPQLSENVGAVARAMLNCGLGDLRLVAPACAPLDARAVAMAAGAHRVLEGARLFSTLPEALADTTWAYGTTARTRGPHRDALTPETMAVHAADHQQHGGDGPAQGKIAFVFGGERAGLSNDDLSHVNSLVTIPLYEGFSSLNLAAAVLLVVYTWRRYVGFAGTSPQEENRACTGVLSGEPHPVTQPPTTTVSPMAKAQLFHMLDLLEHELECRGYFRLPEKKPLMVQNMRLLFHKILLGDHEIQTFYGIFQALCRPPQS